ncbi:MAG: hypothetical protein FWE86_05535, partial [Oscillospiraceae bacterium]|nr:hypothetical protein [Oscillospiraceae bacterium]
MKKSVVVLAFFLAVVMLIPGCDMPTVSGQDLGDPSVVVFEFISLMKERKFSEASNLLDKSVSLNLENGLDIPEDDPVALKLADFLLDSYSAEPLPDGVKTQGRSAEIWVSFTSLSCEALATHMAEL